MSILSRTETTRSRTETLDSDRKHKQGDLHLLDQRDLVLKYRAPPREWNESKSVSYPKASMDPTPYLRKQFLHKTIYVANINVEYFYHLNYRMVTNRQGKLQFGLWQDIP
ncbi:hypothetical protein CR513_09384, partial [Mucuna pruriens]